MTGISEKFKSPLKSDQLDFVCVDKMSFYLTIRPSCGRWLIIQQALMQLNESLQKEDFQVGKLNMWVSQHKLPEWSVQTKSQFHHLKTYSLTTKHKVDKWERRKSRQLETKPIKYYPVAEYSRVPERERKRVGAKIN